MIENCKKDELDLDENENNHIHSHIEKINPGKSKLYFNPDTIDYKAKPWMKRTDLNADAYKLLNSYHYKTHFKAAKEVAGNNIKSKEKNNNNNKKNKNKYCLLLPNLFQNKSTNNFEILNPAYNDIKNKSNELIEINMEEGEDDEKQNKEEMQMKYDKNKNPFKKKGKLPYKMNQMKLSS